MNFLWLICFLSPPPGQTDQHPQSDCLLRQRPFQLQQVLSRRQEETDPAAVLETSTSFTSLFPLPYLFQDPKWVMEKISTWVFIVLDSMVRCWHGPLYQWFHWWVRVGSTQVYRCLFHALVCVPQKSLWRPHDNLIWKNETLHWQQNEDICCVKNLHRMNLSK